LNERTFHGGPDRLRDPVRVSLMEIDRVVTLSCEGISVRSMLDVGTGTALFAEAFFKAGMSVAGIDISEDMLSHARRFVPSGNFKTGSIEKIPFDDGSFDLVFLGHVLHEADDMMHALSEARRVARIRVAVLEFPYVEEAMGPPIAHRLRPEDIVAGAQEAGFVKVNNIRLKCMELYLMDVSNSLHAGDSDVRIHNIP
jgi:ubiquinone/menaquinone biosynthesis C-methylase UbiE